MAAINYLEEDEATLEDVADEQYDQFVETLHAAPESVS
jgi:hypothetical protein